MQSFPLHIPGLCPHLKHSEILLAIDAKSFTFIYAEGYFRRDGGGYFSLSFMVTVPEMITPATVWNALMQTAVMSGIGCRPLYPHLCHSHVQVGGFLQLRVFQLKTQAPSKKILFGFEHHNVSAEKETDFSCGLWS